MGRDILEAVPLETQPDLLDVSQYPHDPALVDMVRARSFLPNPRPKRPPRWSGKIIMREFRSKPDLAVNLCTAILWGMPLHECARTFHRSPHTILWIRDAMEGRGELAPIKEQCIKGLWRMLQLGQECVIDGLMGGRIHPGQAWIPTVATWDKLQATHAGGEERTAKGDALPAIVAERVEALRRLAGRASDSGSGVAPTQVADDDGPGRELTGNRDALATGSDGVAAGPDGHAGTQAGPVAAGGGGGSVPPAAIIPNGSVAEISDAKELSVPSLVDSPPGT